MTDETTARIRAEVAGVAREMVESWEGDMTALTKEERDALPKVARYELDYDSDYCGPGVMSEYKDGEYVLFTDFAATVIKQQAKIEVLRALATKAIDEWESHIDDQYAGTSHYDDMIAEVRAARETLKGTEE